MERCENYDVVIVGAGVAGLVGAIAAAKSGLGVIVLEKSGLVGGAAAWAYGAIWVPGSDLAIAAGIVDDPDAISTYVNYVCGGENDPERTKALIENAPHTLRYLNELGIGINFIPGVGDLLFGKAPGAVRAGRTHEPAAVRGSVLGDWRALLSTPTGDTWRLPISRAAKAPPAEIALAVTAAIADDQLARGPALVAQLMVAARGLGVRIELRSDVTEIRRSGERVSGVATRDGMVVNAQRGVLLATGAYLSNESLVARFDSLPGYHSMMPEGSDGDGLKLAAEIGASFAITRNNLAMNVGYYNPAHPAAPLHPASVWELPRAHLIMVNRQGNRFGNESTFQEYAPALRAYDPKTRRLKNLPCWMIFDSTYVERWGFAGEPPGSVPAWLTSASTIAELAEKMGIDPAGLVKTIDRFSLFCETGVDDDFGRVPGWDMQPGAGQGINASLGKISRSPYYAVELSPTLQVGGAGIKADFNACAINWSGNPIAGLYVVGDIAAHDDFGTGYQAGLSLVSCMTFGKLAVDHILQNIKTEISL